jgi:D-serine deaminase-like pyridoxal phosphate-dependent protein
LNLQAINEAPLGLECKPFAAELWSTPLERIGELGITLGDPRLQLPALLLRRSALEHNVGLMAAYCARNGLDLAPHGKTTMAPQIFAAQLGAGAWGMTAATVGQAQVMRAFGVGRILIANQLVGAAAAAWVARELEQGAELFALVDSVEGVARLDSLLGGTRRLPVLVELGMDGRRGGQRSSGGARAVAEAVGRASHLRLAGIECFEGVAGTDREPETLARVDSLVGAVAAAAAELDRDGAFDDEVILSAGGSLYFDRLGPLVELKLSRPVRVVARSGCYVTHDSGLYARGSPLDGLRPALELWGEVLSRPEPDLAIVGLGRRDAGHDAGLPIPSVVGWETTELNDQHAFLRGSGTPLEVGDLVGFGISHPCTTLDKWRVIPLVDDETVVGAVRTFF